MLWSIGGYLSSGIWKHEVKGLFNIFVNPFRNFVEIAAVSGRDGRVIQNILFFFSSLTRNKRSEIMKEKLDC